MSIWPSHSLKKQTSQFQTRTYDAAKHPSMLIGSVMAQCAGSLRENLERMLQQQVRIETIRSRSSLPTNAVSQCTHPAETLSHQPPGLRAGTRQLRLLAPALRKKPGRDVEWVMASAGDWSTGALAFTAPHCTSCAEKGRMFCVSLDWERGAGADYAELLLLWFPLSSTRRRQASIKQTNTAAQETASPRNGGLPGQKTRPPRSRQGPSHHLHIRTENRIRLPPHSPQSLPPLGTHPGQFPQLATTASSETG